MCEPEAHTVQLPCPAEEYLPEAQRSHASSAPGLNEPATQFAHAAAPLLVLNLPAGQARQAASSALSVAPR